MSAPQPTPVEPILTAFWDLFDWLAVRVPARPGLNMTNDPSVIAFNITHFEALSRHFKKPLPAPLPEIKRALRHSTAPRFIHEGVYNCHDGKGRHCMIFGLLGVAT